MHFNNQIICYNLKNQSFNLDFFTKKFPLTNRIAGYSDAIIKALFYQFIIAKDEGKLKLSTDFKLHHLYIGNGYEKVLSSIQTIWKYFKLTDEFNQINEKFDIEKSNEEANKQINEVINLIKENKTNTAIDNFNLGVCLINGIGCEKNEALGKKKLQRGFNNKNASQDVATHQTFYKGLSYLEGIHETKNVKKGFKLLNEAALAGSLIAKVYVGCCYLKGIGVNQNPEKAIEWFEQAAGENSWAAKIHLGCCYLKGIGVDKNPENAFKLFKEASKEKSATAQVYLSYCYKAGMGTELSYKKYLHYLNKAAKNGSAIALVELGDYYRKRMKSEADEQSVFSYYSQAAQLGSILAHERISTYFENDYIIEEIIESTVNCVFDNTYESEINFEATQEDIQQTLNSAKNGNPASQYYLAMYYLIGNGVEQSTEIAISWLKKSAEQGYSDSHYQLGRVLISQSAELTDKNEASEKLKKSAIECFEKASVKGNLKAEQWLYDFYMSTIQKMATGQEILDYLNYRVESGSFCACTILGNYYLKGQKIKKNEELGLKYLEEARLNSQTIAIYLLANYHYSNLKNTVIQTQQDKELLIERKQKIFGLYETAAKNGFIQSDIEMHQIKIEYKKKLIHSLNYRLENTLNNEFIIQIRDKIKAINDQIQCESELLVLALKKIKNTSSTAKLRIGEHYFSKAKAKINFLTAVKYLQKAHSEGSKEASSLLCRLFAKPKSLFEPGKSTQISENQIHRSFSPLINPVKAIQYGKSHAKKGDVAIARTLLKIALMNGDIKARIKINNIIYKHTTYENEKIEALNVFARESSYFRSKIGSYIFNDPLKAGIKIDPEANTNIIAVPTGNHYVSIYSTTPLSTDNITGAELQRNLKFNEAKLLKQTPEGRKKLLDNLFIQRWKKDFILALDSLNKQ